MDIPCCCAEKGHGSACATPGSLGVAPDIRKLSNVRISYVKYPGGSPVEIREEHYAFGENSPDEALDWESTVL